MSGGVIVRVGGCLSTRKSGWVESVGKCGRRVGKCWSNVRSAECNSDSVLLAMLLCCGVEGCVRLDAAPDLGQARQRALQASSATKGTIITTAPTPRVQTTDQPAARSTGSRI